MGLIVSGTQIWIAEIGRNNELSIEQAKDKRARAERQERDTREWKFNTLKFVRDNYKLLSEADAVVVKRLLIRYMPPDQLEDFNEAFEAADGLSVPTDDHRMGGGDNGAAG
jgi:hypothetical protein